MYSRGIGGALIGTLLVLAGCGGSENNGGTPAGVSGSCQVSGGLTVQVSVNAVAGPVKELGGDTFFTILTNTNNQGTDVVTGNLVLNTPPFVAGRTYTLADGKAQTAFVVTHGPTGSKTQWLAGSLSGLATTNGSVSLTLTSFGTSASDVAHGTLVATLKPNIPPTGSDVTVNCTF